MQAKQDTWCCKELSSVELSDKRLNRRLLKVANDLLNYPDAPIHEACSKMSYIWRGWEKLALIAEFWKSLKRATCR
ncbi:MAG: transposase DNA-binding-containing protein [Chlamydiota bacterium]